MNTSSTRRTTSPLVTYSNVTEFAELLCAFRLVHSRYAEAGFISPCPSNLHFTLQDLLPNAFNIIAKENGKVVGTLTTIVESSHILPSSAMYPEVLQTCLFSELCVAEGVKFAFKPQKKPYMARNLVRHIFQWWRDVGLDHVFVVVHPRHISFWERTAYFRTIGDEKPCSRVAGNPGVLLSLDMKEIAPLPPNTATTTLTNKICNSVRKRLHFLTLQDTQVALLLLQKPSLLQAHQNPHICSLLKEYPSLNPLIEKLQCGDKEPYLRIRQFNFNQLIDSLTELVKIRADERGIHVGVSPQLEQSISLYGDPIRFAEVLFRIADLVLRHCSKGSRVYLVVQKLRTEQGHSRVAIVFCSDNIDITSKGYHQTICSNFSSIHRSYTEKQGDLSTKQLVELIGGKVRFQQLDNKEALLGIELPYVTCSRPAHRRRIETQSYSKKVLLATTPGAEQALIQRLLAKRGFDTHIAEDGINAISLYRRDKYEFVILDYFLPKISWLHLAREIRYWEKLSYSRRTLIIGIVSYLPLAKTIFETEPQPINVVLPRPFSIPTFYRIVDTYYPNHSENNLRKVG